MKIPSSRGDSSVSEIIGTLFIFAIIVSMFSTFIVWYIPFSGSQYENQYGAATSDAISSFSSQLYANSITNHSLIYQNMPLGIQGDFFNRPTNTEISQSDQFNISVHYNVSIQGTYSGNTPPGLISNSIVGNPVPVGQNPDGVVVDTVNNLIFILNSNYTQDTSAPRPGSITVLSGATDLAIHNISLSGFPLGVAFNPKNNLIYVAEGNISNGNFGTSTYAPTFQDGFIQVISGNAPFELVKTVEFAATPDDVTYVPYLNSVMITVYWQGGYGGAVATYNATSEVETGYIIVAHSNSGVIPSSISYDPANGYVYVALGNGTQGIAIINPIIQQIIGYIPAQTPWSLAYDTSSGDIFVTESYINHNDVPSTNSPSRTVFTLDGANNQQVTSYSQFNTPVSLVYDRANHFVYVADFGASAIDIFAGSNGTFLGSINGYPSNSGPGNGPNAMDWNPLNGQIYVPNWYSGTVSIISGSTSLSNHFASNGQRFKPVETMKGFGQVQAFGATPFSTQNYYDLQDGFAVLQGSGGSFGQSLSGLPMELYQKGGLLNLSLNVVNLSGQDSSVSQSGSYLLSGTVTSMERQTWNTGMVLNYLSGGTEYSVTVSSILLNNLTITINSSDFAAWNYSFFQQYNSSLSSYDSNPNGTVWEFANYHNAPFKMTVGKDSIELTLESGLLLQSFGIDYMSVLTDL
ncbi:MAG: hypothetical protein M1151_03460 [Candidatus Thermoplasmatota archaeon]|jgi:DNA-binding beta-propeller fold protein YncE|nr:hypothetical protein [Candidatus Thermoplasmatota archaeon]MCL5785713.1 hypothetical protein [Candidatus Thermoplasmatota archaeon]